MREIKFRAWDGKEIWKVTGVQFANNSDFVNLYGTEPEWIATGIYEDKTSKRLMFMSSPDCELMQYTGVKDKNGMDVYECDILQFIPSIVIGAVTYSTQLAGYILKGGGENSKDMRLNSSAFAECEVIGNVYENPELIKGDTKL